MGKSFCSIINKGTTSSLLTTELGDIGIKEKTFFFNSYDQEIRLFICYMKKNILQFIKSQEYTAVH